MSFFRARSLNRKSLKGPADGLEEHYGFDPRDGLTDDIERYEMLVRLTYDNVADFGWGTNWLYILVPNEDLKHGDLSRFAFTAANS